MTYGDNDDDVAVSFGAGKMQTTIGNALTSSSVRAIKYFFEASKPF